MSKKGNPDKLAERVASLEMDIGWIKKKLDNVERRTWEILGSVVVFGVISIIIALISSMPK